MSMARGHSIILPLPRDFLDGLRRFAENVIRSEFADVEPLGPEGAEVRYAEHGADAPQVLRAEVAVADISSRRRDVEQLFRRAQSDRSGVSVSKRDAADENVFEINLEKGGEG